VKKELGFSERRICKVIKFHRSSLRYRPVKNEFSEKLRTRVTEVAAEFGRYGYRQVTGFLNMEGWDVGKDRVYTIWKQEGLKVPQKQPKRARLWLADGSCIRQRPEYRNHVWSYDFVSEETHDGRKIKILNVIDEFSRECLLSLVARRIRSQDVIFALADLFLKHGVPKHIRSDNGPEFIAAKLRKWLGKLEVQPLYIHPGSPWENGYCESFNGKMRYELLNGEIFFSLLEAKVIIEKWRNHYNTKRPHSSLGYRPPAPEVFKPNFREAVVQCN
jgi:transposase InsO family protein